MNVGPAADQDGALAWLAAALEAWEPGAPNTILDLAGLGTDQLTELDDRLGRGEVAVVAGEQRIHECRLPGVWRHDSPPLLEVGPAPTLPTVAPLPGPLPVRPDDLMNGEPIVAEVTTHAAAYRPGDPPHQVHLSHLPLTPGDLAFVEASLGERPVRIHMRGYGETHITGAALDHVWHLRHLNASGQTILSTIEIGDLPEVIRATPEDLADAANEAAAMAAQD